MAEDHAAELADALAGLDDAQRLRAEVGERLARLEAAFGRHPDHPGLGERVEEARAWAEALEAMEFLARDAVNRAEAAVDPSIASVGMLPPPPRPTDRAREAAVPLVTETCLVGEDGELRPVGTGEGTFTFASPEGRG